MNNSSLLANWWTSRTIAEKERLSAKAYPACSTWWLSLSEEEQTALMTAQCKSARLF